MDTHGRAPPRARRLRTFAALAALLALPATGPGARAGAEAFAPGREAPAPVRDDAAPPPPPPLPRGAPADRALEGAVDDDDPAIVRFPGIRIDPTARRVEVEAWFAVVNAATRLEYLAVTDRGKVHEALVVIECAPEHLQLGLILLGLEPLPEVRYQGEARALRGPRVAIEARFEKDGEAIAVPVESLLYDLYRAAPLEPEGFAFTGSRFRERAPGSPVFAAEATGNAIALYHDPDACLDNPRLEGGDIPLLAPTFGGVELVDWLYGDDRLVPRESVLPDRGTTVRLVIAPLAASPASRTGDSGGGAPGAPARPGEAPAEPGTGERPASATPPTAPSPGGAPPPAPPREEGAR